MHFFFHSQRSNNGSDQLLSQESECIFYKDKRKSNWPCQPKLNPTVGLNLKFLTSLQNNKENPPPPYFILRAHNMCKSTNSHFVVRVIKISRKEFKGCVDSDISISSVCWLTDQPYWCKKIRIYILL